MEDNLVSLFPVSLSYRLFDSEHHDLGSQNSKPQVVVKSPSTLCDINDHSSAKGAFSPNYCEDKQVCRNVRDVPSGHLL